MKNAAALLEEYSMKRIISFFLCVLMTAALLAGCGDRKQRTTWIIAVDGDFSPFVCADANGKARPLQQRLPEACPGWPHRMPPSGPRADSRCR